MFIKQLGEVVKKECRSHIEEINSLRTEVNILKNSNTIPNFTESISKLMRNIVSEKTEILVNEISGLQHEINNLKTTNSELTDHIQKDICVSEQVQSLRREIEILKSSNIDLINLLSKDPNVGVIKNTTYAQTVQNSSESSVVIKPRNIAQTVKQTKSDVLQSLKPLASEIEINKVKPLSHGGLMIKCMNKNQSEKLVNVAGSKLADTYDIKKTTPILPRVRIVGIPEGLNIAEVENYVRVQNPSIFNSESLCQVNKICPTSKDKNIFQVECTVDLKSYTKLLDTGHILVGLNGCGVYDALSLLRCYKCNGFNHGSKRCNKQVICPRCSDSHELKNCPLSKDSKDLRCSNCLHLRDSQKLDIEVSHAAWEYNKCFSYKLTTAKLKQDLFNIPNLLTAPKLSNASSMETHIS